MLEVLEALLFDRSLPTESSVCEAMERQRKQEALEAEQERKRRTVGTVGRSWMFSEAFLIVMNRGRGGCRVVGRGSTVPQAWFFDWQDLHVADVTNLYFMRSKCLLSSLSKTISGSSSGKRATLQCANWLGLISWARQEEEKRKREVEKQDKMGDVSTFQVNLVYSKNSAASRIRISICFVIFCLVSATSYACSGGGAEKEGCRTAEEQGNALALAAGKSSD